MRKFWVELSGVMCKSLVVNLVSKYIKEFKEDWQVGT
jgi:hypothetical protein